MPVLPVAPGEEPAGECLGIRKRPVPIRKVWSVLERFELGFRVWVVMTGMWPAVGLGDAHVGKFRR
jgi:hypothetical protein